MSAASANATRVGQLRRRCQAAAMIDPVPGYVWGFAAFAVPFVATPGASTAVVLRNSVAGGVRAGVATAAGVNIGSLAYGLVTAFGVSVALQRWPDVWIGLRLVGVGYLAWLGVRSLWRALSGEPPIA